MNRKSQLIHAAGKSYAAKEMRQYFGFDQWESDPEIRKDEIDFVLAAADLRRAGAELPEHVHPGVHAGFMRHMAAFFTFGAGWGGRSRLRGDRPHPGGCAGQRAYGLHGTRYIGGSVRGIERRYGNGLQRSGMDV